jgi:hypothetical protein
MSEHVAEEQRPASAAGAHPVKSFANQSNTYHLIDTRYTKLRHALKGSLVISSID